METIFLGTKFLGKIFRLKYSRGQYLNILGFALGCSRGVFLENPSNITLVRLYNYISKNQ